MKNVKYYMNNPCVIIRKVSDDFSEIKLTPKYADEFEGAQWCTECMVGNQGTPTRHTCVEAQEVIDIINDSQASIVVMVENRLLHDEPVEFLQIKPLQEHIAKLSALNATLNEKNIGLESEIKAHEAKINDFDAEVKAWERKCLNAKKELDSINESISKARNALSLLKSQSDGKVSIGYTELKRLLKSDIELSELEANGVDNWVGYEYDEERINNEADARMQKYIKK